VAIPTARAVVQITLRVSRDRMTLYEKYLLLFSQIPNFALKQKIVTATVLMYYC